MVCHVRTPPLKTLYMTTVVLSGASVDTVGACETTTYELELVAQDCPGGSAADGMRFR